MGEITDRFNTTYREFIVDGVPSSGANEPRKSDIRALALPIEAGVAAAALANNLPEANALIAPLLTSAQAAQAAAEGALVTLDQALDAIPASVADQLDEAVENATQQANASRDAAGLAAATALAAGRYFPTRTAGEAASTTDQLFSTDDGAGNVIYYRRTSGGSTEIGRTVTPASLSASTGPSLVGRFASVSALLSSTDTARGQTKSWQAGASAYVEAAPDAVDEHVSTAAGVKLYAVPVAEVFTAQSFGIDPANTSSVNSTRLDKLLTAANGRKVVLQPGRLKAALSFTGPVNMQGSGEPTVNAGRTALEGGTVIEGNLSFSNQSVMLTDFGVDHGSAAFATGSDVLKISAATYDAGRLALLRNIVALGRNPTDAFHAILIEGYEQAEITNVTGAMNQYCAAIKSRNVMLRGFRGIRGQNGIIFKSDGASAGSGSLGNVSASGITIEGSTDTVYGVRILAANRSISNVIIDDVNVMGADYGLVVEVATGVAISELQVTNFNGRDIRLFGISTGGAGALYEARLAGFNLAELGDYAAQFQIGNIKLRDFYGSLKAGSTAHAATMVRAEATLSSLSVNNMELVENYGAGAAKPALYLGLNPLLTRLSGEMRYVVEGNVPEPGFNAQALSGTTATLVALPDLIGGRSTCAVSTTAPTTVTTIDSTMPGTATKYPRGYLLTVLNVSASALTFQNNGNIRPRGGADLVVAINQTVTFAWLGSSWHQVN